MSRMPRIVLCHPIIRLIRDSDLVGKLFLAKSLAAVLLAGEGRERRLFVTWRLGLAVW